MRVAMWLALVVLVIWAWRSGRPRGASPSRRTDARRPERMVQCARCRVHFPSSEALADASGRLFCCDEHRGA